MPVSDAPNDQVAPAIVADGSAGAIITWHDRRNGDNDIFAQRLNSAGKPQWSINGVVLCAATGDQSYPAMASDGAGGAIVTWNDDRNGHYSHADIYAQRINASGLPLWTADGVAICTATNLQLSPRIVSDGAGGAIITWDDYRDGTSDVYAQRVGATGACQWAANGEPLSTASNDQTGPTIISDGHGGGIVAWADKRSGVDYHVYAQRIDAGGVSRWTTDGVALCTAANDQMFSGIASDGAGGAIITWDDYRSGDGDVYAQRVSATGAPLWAPNGVVIVAALSEQVGSIITSDGAGGAIVAWTDNRSGIGYGEYAQRVNASGVRQWIVDGVPLCTAPGTSVPFPAVASDGSGGAIVTWQDYRGGINFDIYAQRVLSTGAVDSAWPVDGRALCTAVNVQWRPEIIADGAGGAIVTWEDHRNGSDGSNGDVYAQRVKSDGQLGGDAVTVPGEPSFTLDPVRPNPTRGGVLSVQFALARATAASLDLFDVTGRRITEREVGSLGTGRHVLDLDVGRRLAPGLYLVRLRQGANIRVTRVAVLD